MLSYSLRIVPMAVVGQARLVSRAIPTPFLRSFVGLGNKTTIPAASISTWSPFNSDPFATPLRYVPGHQYGGKNNRSGFSTSPDHIPISGSGTAGKKEDKQASAHDTTAHVVTTAIASNCAVCLGKFGTFLYTGSGTMLAEAVHSLADVMNQVLLAVGHRRSARPPDKTHPYGYAREQFVWALISAVGIFFVGGGASIYHGIHELIYPPELSNFEMAYGMLAFSAVAEGGSLYVAYKAINKGCTEMKMSFKDYINKGGDPITVAVFMEDSAAVLGLGVASTCLGLAQYTGMTGFDAVGSILIGNILGAVAIFLINRNMGSLVGRTVEKRRLTKIWDLLREDPVVQSVHDIKAEVMGSEILRFKADIEFDGEVVCKRYLELDGNGEEIVRQLDACSTAAEKEAILVEYGRSVIEALGDEVDRIEEDIQKALPAVQFIDLET